MKLKKLISLMLVTTMIVGTTLTTNFIADETDKKNNATDYIVVTNNEKYITMANEAVLLPKEAEGVAGVFGMAVFSQLFACLLSLARGYNPDEPIGLSKTTVTF